MGWLWGSMVHPFGIPRTQTRGIRSIRANFAWTLVGNGVYASCQWGMLIVLAKLGDPEMVGRFALGLAVTAPIVMFANLNLAAVIRTDARRAFELSDYLSLRLLTAAGSLIPIAIVLVIAGYRREIAMVVMAVGIAKSIESVSNLLYGSLQLHEQMDRVALSLLLKGPLSLIALAGGVWLTGDLFWGVLALAAAWAALLVTIDMHSVWVVTGKLPPRRLVFPGPLYPRWNPSSVRRLTWLALPLGAVTLLTSLNVNVPRFVVERYLGERELGIFAAMAYLMIAGNMVISALGESASSRLATLYAAGDSARFWSLLGKLVGFAVATGTICIVVSALAGPRLLSLLYTSEYAHYGRVFILLVVAAALGFVALFLTYGLTAMRRFQVQTPLAGVVLVVTAVGAVLLTPRYGLEGTAASILGGNAVAVVGGATVLAHARRCAELQIAPAAQVSR